MLIAFATVVEKEERWTFSGCLAWEGVLTLFGVEDIPAQPCFTWDGLPVDSTIWNSIPHSSTTESACQWVHGNVSIPHVVGDF
jgi:hypothetical protein